VKGPKGLEPSTGGAVHVAVGVSHNDQKSLLRAWLDTLSLGTVKVDIANRLQGHEFDARRRGPRRRRGTRRRARPAYVRLDAAAERRAVTE
jgi:hypothetical protein